MNKEIPVIPCEYIGEQLSKNKYVDTTPRRWTSKEVEWCLKLDKDGYSNKEIAKSVGRSEVSVSIKMKRLKKKDGRYNTSHAKEKHETNIEFIEYLQPESVLDLYCGTNKIYANKAKTVITNDIDKSIEADYNLDALKLLCHLHYEGKSFDFIDLDPYGSASECFDLAIKMAKKGMSVTLGELGHKRFKRLDYVSRHYGIDALEDFTTDNLISFIQKVGLKHKKQLNIYKKCEWNSTSKVWFTIDDVKITEQWD